MSKNIEIQEGGVTKQFGGVQKICVAEQGGGTVTFIPEDEADSYANLGEGSFTKNGTYYAAASGLAGFSSVRINVPSDGSNAKADGLLQDLMTNTTAYALTPKIRNQGNGWEWVDGDKTFSGNSMTQKIRQYVTIAGTEQKLSYMPLVVPNDYTAIAESETTMLTTLSGEQIYFKDLTTLAAGGFTTVSPKEYNPTISDLVLDMHKCRRLQGSDAATDIIKTYGTITSQVVNNDTVLNFDVGIDLMNDASVNLVKTATAEKYLDVKLKDANAVKRGIRIKEDGVYYTNDGINYKLLGEGGGADSPIGKVKIIDHAITVADIDTDYNVYVAYDPTITPYITNDGLDIIQVTSDNAGHGIFVKRETPAPPPTPPQIPKIKWVWASNGENDSDTHTNAEVQFGVMDDADPSAPVTDTSLWDWYLDNPDNIPDITLTQTGRLIVGNITDPTYQDMSVQVSAKWKTDPTIETDPYSVYLLVP